MKITSNNVMLLNINKINMNRYDIESYLFTYIYNYFSLFSLVSIVSLVSHAPSGPPYTPASYSHGIASLAG